MHFATTLKEFQRFCDIYCALPNIARCLIYLPSITAAEEQVNDKQRSRHYTGEGMIASTPRACLQDSTDRSSRLPFLPWWIPVYVPGYTVIDAGAPFPQWWVEASDQLALVLVFNSCRSQRTLCCAWLEWWCPGWVCGSATSGVRRQ